MVIEVVMNSGRRLDVNVLVRHSGDSNTEVSRM